MVGRTRAVARRSAQRGSLRRAAARLFRAAALSGGLIVIAAPSAFAGPPACPSAPVAYTGTDQTVAAITQLDADTVASCQAQSARLDQVDSDSNLNAGQAHSDAQTITTAVQKTADTVAGWTAASPLNVAFPGGGSGQAVQVTNWPGDQTVGLDTTSAGQLDGNAQSEHGDLWVLIGVIVGCFLFDVFLRKAWP